MRQRARAALISTLALGSWFVASCCSDLATEPQTLPECAGPVTVLVAGDTIPVFSWTPNCTLGRLIVEEGVEERWGTETLGANSYASPITYGVNPPNSSKEEPPLPLFLGTTYRVSVYRWVSVVPESLQLLGETEFTP